MEDINGFKVINSRDEDCHVHTSTFSDGFNSVDEVVIHAGKIGIKKIVLTDHCQFYLDQYGYGKKTHRNIANRWENIHNDVEVKFGVESDIINVQGDISTDIQGIESDYIILSAHPKVYTGADKSITRSYLNAIERHSEKIMFLGHLCSKYFEQSIDVIPIIELAMEKGVAFELNYTNLMGRKTNVSNLEKMLSRVTYLYVNSDAHTLGELSRCRQGGFKFLEAYQRP